MTRIVPAYGNFVTIEDSKTDLQNESDSQHDKASITSQPTFGYAENPYVELPKWPKRNFKSSKYDQTWNPDNWQLSASTNLYYSDNMAGFYNDGIYVTGLESDGKGRFTLEAGGFSTASGNKPFRLDYSFVRKRATGQHPGEFESKGPSIRFGLSHQSFQVTDHKMSAELTSDQLMNILDETATDIGDDFSSDMPMPDSLEDLSDGAAMISALQAWLDDKVNNIPGIVQSGFAGYNPEDDYDLSALTSTSYKVHSLKFDTNLCLEDSVWRYDRRFNFINSGQACLEGSALYFTGNHFEQNFYVGVGPYFEFNLLSYHQKPFHKPDYYDLDPQTEFIPPSLTVSSYIYAGAQYYNGLHLDQGYSDAFDPYNRFVTANIGLGLRTTIPSFSKRKE